MENPPRAKEAREGCSWGDLLGPTLCVDTETSRSTDSLLHNKSLVLLYFSAHWCPPCQAFTPKLRSFYQVARKLGVEIVYVSSDRSANEFQEYYGTKMPWLALPIDQSTVNAKLASTFQIRGIPALIVLDRNGKFVTDQARQHVVASLNPQSVVDAWKSTPAVSISDAPLGGGPIANMTLSQALWQAAVHILKNPIYVFGLIYLVKYYLRHDAGTVGENGVPVEDNVQDEHDSEF